MNAFSIRYSQKIVNFTTMDFYYHDSKHVKQNSVILRLSTKVNTNNPDGYYYARVYENIVTKLDSHRSPLGCCYKCNL